MLLCTLAENLDRKRSQGLARAAVIYADRVRDSCLQAVTLGMEIRYVLTIPSRKPQAVRTVAASETRHLSLGASNQKVNILTGSDEPGGIP